MPPAQPLPEVPGVSSNDNDNDNENDDKDRQRHIEVCARIRPLTIQKESSNSFFEKQSQSQTQAQTPSAKSGLRRPGLPRPSSLRTPPPRPKTAAAAATPPPAPPPPPASAPPQTYAWDCIGGDTVSQRNDIGGTAELVRGRTHAYTLDRVYGPDESTQQLYDSSIQSLVHAAMDGYHSSILAYGQTSTGKTHTMTGTATTPGIIPLSVRECFDYLERQDDHDQPREYLLRVSYLEGT
jgi:hypothetical protein